MHTVAAVYLEGPSVCSVLKGTLSYDTYVKLVNCWVKHLLKRKDAVPGCADSQIPYFCKSDGVRPCFCRNKMMPSPLNPTCKAKSCLHMQLAAVKIACEFNYMILWMYKKGVLVYR